MMGHKEADNTGYIAPKKVVITSPTTFKHPPPLERYIVKVKVKSIQKGKLRIPQPDELY